jgi:hypothetical protein
MRLGKAAYYRASRDFGRPAQRRETSEVEVDLKKTAHNRVVIATIGLGIVVETH